MPVLEVRWRWTSECSFTRLIQRDLPGEFSFETIRSGAQTQNPQGAHHSLFLINGWCTPLSLCLPLPAYYPTLFTFFPFPRLVTLWKRVGSFKGAVRKQGRGRTERGSLELGKFGVWLFGQPPWLYTLRRLYPLYLLSQGEKTRVFAWPTHIYLLFQRIFK